VLKIGTISVPESEKQELNSFAVFSLEFATMMTAINLSGKHINRQQENLYRIAGELAETLIPEKMHIQQKVMSEWFFAAIFRMFRD
jgi:hypothetical protein